MVVFRALYVRSRIARLIITEEHDLHPRRSVSTLVKARARLWARHNIRNSEFGFVRRCRSDRRGDRARRGADPLRGCLSAPHVVCRTVGRASERSSRHDRAVAAADRSRRRRSGIRDRRSDALWRWKPRDIVDAIEANGLHGGHMSLSDSLRLPGLTVLWPGSARVGRARGRLYPAWRRDCLAVWPPYAFSAGGDLGGHLSAVARQRRSPPRSTPPPRRRVLRLSRADYRQLHAGDAGAGRPRRIFATYWWSAKSSATSRFSSSTTISISAAAHYAVILAVVGFVAGFWRSWRWSASLLSSNGRNAPRCRVGRDRRWAAWCWVIWPGSFPEILGSGHGGIEYTISHSPQSYELLPPISA